MISDNDIEKALDYLRNNAIPAAQARAERLYMEDFSKVVKSQLMNELITESIGAQERHAYSHIKYAQHLQAMKEAIAADEKHRFLMAAAEARIEAWRSMQANARAQGKIG